MNSSSLNDIEKLVRERREFIPGGVFTMTSIIVSQAKGAEGAFSFMSRYIPYIDIFQTDGKGQLPGLPQGFNRGGEEIAQLIHDVKAGEVDGDIGTNLPFDPEAHLSHHSHIVVLAGDYQVNQLQVAPLRLKVLMVRRKGPSSPSVISW